MRGCLQGLTSALPEVVMLWPMFFLGYKGVSKAQRTTKRKGEGASSLSIFG